MGTGRAGDLLVVEPRSGRVGLELLDKGPDTRLPVFPEPVPVEMIVDRASSPVRRWKAFS